MVEAYLCYKQRALTCPKWVICGAVAGDKDFLLALCRSVTLGISHAEWPCSCSGIPRRLSHSALSAPPTTCGPARANSITSTSGNAGDGPLLSVSNRAVVSTDVAKVVNVNL